MKKVILASAVTLALASTAAQAEDVKIGVMMSFTGPIESLTPAMASGAEMALAEVSESGALLDGTTLTPVRADGTCIDSAAATAAAERLVTSDGIVAMVGPDCSGITSAVLANVAVPNGIAIISPSATSPALSTAEDEGLFFRTAPSDARQGQVMAEVLQERGVESVAITYTNNDYGKGLADAIQAAYEGLGGEVSIVAAHDDGKADYSSEVAALAAAGGDVLIVAGYVDQGGKGIIQASLDTGAFDTFAMPDGMISDTLGETFGSDIDGSFGTVPGTDSPGVAKLLEMGEAAGVAADGPFVAESYDAAALIALAMQAAKSTSSSDFAGSVEAVANAPGEKIYPGELAKALAILAEGGEVDYEGASAVELINGGESAGNYREILMDGAEITTAKFR